MNAWRGCALLGCLAMLGGCVNLAPQFSRPAAPVPRAWQSAGPTNPSGSVTDLGWRAVYTDPHLQQVIDQALANNRDLRVAILDIEKARAEFRQQGAELWPSIAATASQSASRSPASANGGGATRTDAVELGFSAYELDMFGRLRNLSDASRELYLASAETRRATQISLIAQVATAWFQLAADRRLLSLSRQMLDSETKTHDLIVREHSLGAASALDEAQADEALQGYRGDLAASETTVAKDRDALDLLVGAPLDESLLPTDHPGTTVVAPPIPQPLSSEVLLERPDILAAEHDLRAANADVGAARADFFPQITLTAADGTASHQLHGLFKPGSHAWSFSPSISLPLFDGGARRGALDEAKVDKDIQVANYEKAIQVAFSEVADALAVRANLAERIDAQTKAVAAAQKSYDLAQALYRQGSYSLIDVLSVQRTLYVDQQALVNVQLSEETSAGTVYKVLGGGMKR